MKQNTIFYKKYDKNIKLKLNDVIEDLRKHGRALVRDPKVMRSLNIKFKKYENSDIIVCGKTNDERNINIIALNPNYEIKRNTRCFTVKMKNW